MYIRTTIVPAAAAVSLPLPAQPMRSSDFSLRKSHLAKCFAVKDVKWNRCQKVLRLQ